MLGSLGVLSLFYAFLQQPGLENKYYIPIFTNEEAEAQNGEGRILKFTQVIVAKLV